MLVKAEELIILSLNLDLPLNLKKEEFNNQTLNPKDLNIFTYNPVSTNRN